MSSDAVAIFATLRPQLIRIASRVLGRADEADDIVQEAWIRWQNCDRTQVRDAFAFLATTTARLASNAVQSAHARRERHFGSWQQEPPGTVANPEIAAVDDEAVEFALRLTLEKLSPSERAAYVLRHAFDYPYARIAGILQQTEAGVRQHVSRARKRLSGGKCAWVNAHKHRQLLEAFVAGAKDGNLSALEKLLAADVVHGEIRYGPTPIDTSLTRNRSHSEAVSRSRRTRTRLQSSRSNIVTIAPVAHGPGR
jgi:RNA polymerase sigma-70 factor, ECF subfamily